MASTKNAEIPTDIDIAAMSNVESFPDLPEN